MLSVRSGLVTFMGRGPTEGVSRWLSARVLVAEKIKRDKEAWSVCTRYWAAR